MDVNSIKAELQKLRTIIEAQAEMCIRQIDAIAEELDVNDDGFPCCPKCGEAERLIDSSSMGAGSRTTCLNCDHTYQTEVVSHD